MSILIDPPPSSYDRLISRIAANQVKQHEQAAEQFRRLLIASKIDQLRRSAGLPLGHSWKVHTVDRLEQMGGG